MAAVTTIHVGHASQDVHSRYGIFVKKLAASVSTLAAHIQMEG